MPILRSMEEVDERLLKSRSLMHKDYSDAMEEGETYTAPTDDVWEAAFDIIRRMCRGYLKTHDQVRYPPSISIDYAGGVDIVWGGEGYRLLMTVHRYDEDSSLRACFSGILIERDKKSAERSILGEMLSYSDFSFLLYWLDWAEGYRKSETHSDSCLGL